MSKLSPAAIPIKTREKTKGATPVMKKMVKTLLCLMMALAMSLSLAVPAFAASTCVHSYQRIISRDYTWYDQVTATSHRENRGDLMRCSKCGKQEPSNAWYSETETHTGRTTYTSNHSGSNPTKHTYTKLTNCKHCNYLMNRQSGFTGCTAAGCREAQGLKPVPVDA